MGAGVATAGRVAVAVAAGAESSSDRGRIVPGLQSVTDTG